METLVCVAPTLDRSVWTIQSCYLDQNFRSIHQKHLRKSSNVPCWKQGWKIKPEIHLQQILFWLEMFRYLPWTSSSSLQVLGCSDLKLSKGCIAFFVDQEALRSSSYFGTIIKISRAEQLGFHAFKMVKVWGKAWDLYVLPIFNKRSPEDWQS